MFKKGFEKISGVMTEGLGTVGSNGLGLLTGLVGMAKGPYSKKEQEEADERTWSNVLIPGVGAYRLGRRLSAHAKSKKEKKK